MSSDINECVGAGAACRNGHCTNSLGSFTCECPAGYVLSYDGRDCRGNIASPLTYTFNTSSLINMLNVKCNASYSVQNDMSLRVHSTNER